MAFQSTLAKVVNCAGIGVHSGARACLTIRPAPAGHGIAFRRSDIANSQPIPALGDRVTDVMLGTRIEGDDGTTVSTIEHLMAALAGLEIDNALIEVDGPEVPIMDGSSSVFCDLLLKAGTREQAAPRRRIRVLDTVEVDDGAKHARLCPTPGRYLSMHARIDFNNEVIGVQTVALRFTPGAFAREIAYARTFGFLHEVDYLRQKGLALGGSLDNAVVLDGKDILNPEGLRSEDEFVRHKVLDAVGDLALAGAPIAGHYEVNQPGHAINNALVRKLLDTPEAWCWESDVDAVSRAEPRGELRRAAD